MYHYIPLVGCPDCPGHQNHTQTKMILQVFLSLGNFVNLYRVLQKIFTRLPMYCSGVASTRATVKPNNHTSHRILPRTGQVSKTKRNRNAMQPWGHDLEVDAVFKHKMRTENGGGKRQTNKMTTIQFRRTRPIPALTVPVAIKRRFRVVGIPY